MNEKKLLNALKNLPMGRIRYYQQVGSTNDAALAWATEGAPDYSLVVADEQTAGRGRAGNTWFTHPGSALALSLILCPSEEERERLSFFTALGALALVKVLEAYDIPAKIKWPNDILIDNKKVAGILVETVWMGNEIESIVLGIGLNVHKSSVPDANKLSLEATSLEHVLNQEIDRTDLVPKIFAELYEYRKIMATDHFLQQWEKALAYLGKDVQVWGDNYSSLTGKILGLARDGSLILASEDGQHLQFHFGEVHLRPANQ